MPTIQTYIFDRTSHDLGLKLLKVLVEEFVSTKSDLNTHRKKELKSLLLQQVPAILMLLKHILDTAYDRPAAHLRAYSASTSPTHTFFPDTPSAGFGSNGFNTISPPHGSFDTETQAICKIAMDILSSLFQWIPLGDYVTAGLMDTILKFCRLTDSSSVDMATEAVKCMTELMSRKWMSPHYNDDIRLIFRHVFELLKHLTVSSDSHRDDLGQVYRVGDWKACRPNDNLDDLDEEFRNKLTEFLSIFVEGHIARLDATPGFPMLDFQELLFRYTFKLPDLNGFRDCLKVWNHLLEFIFTKHQTKPCAHEYQQGLLAFGTALIRKCKYTVNASELSDIEDLTEDALGQTEYDVFLDEFLDLVMNLVNLYPGEMIGELYSNLKGLMGMLAEISAQPGMATRSMEQTVTVVYVFKDLRTLLRVFGQLSNKFVEAFSQTLADTYDLLMQFLTVIDHCLNGLAAYRNSPDFVKLCAESYGVFSAYILWLNIFYQNATSDAGMMEKFHNLCSSIIAACLAAFRPDIPPKISQAAGRVFRSVVTNVKPPRFFQYGGVQHFFANIHEISTKLDNSVKCDIYFTSSIACLTLVPNADGNTASQEYRRFISDIVGPYLQLSRSPEFHTNKLYLKPDYRNQLAHVIIVLTAFIQSVEQEKVAIKQVLYDAIKDTVPFTLELFHLYQQDTEILTVIMDMCLALFSSLRKQLGEQLVSAVINAFLTVFTASTINQIVSKDGTAGTDLLNKFLTLLRLIAEDNSKMASNFLLDISQFCLKDCAPPLFTGDSEAREHVREVFLTLISSILGQNWRFFFPARIVTGSPTAGLDPARLEIFKGLLEILARSLTLNNLEHVNQTLRILDDLNKKCRLYTNELFRAQMASSFLSTILSTLISGSHDALRDDFLQTMYGVASVDFSWFYTQFLGPFLATRQLSDQHKQLVALGVSPVQDVPSFTAQMSGLVDDLVYYHRQNAA